ncbi:uncharacterized protein [Sylvia atricapilla]|uniref:uncharacterized protein n=1 Tax=Sylvia atricapilla TaxID=48155 RepID=UPI003393F658
MAAGLRPWLLALALALWPAGLRAQLRLQEAGGGLRAAGDSVTLSCRGSGFTFRDYGIYWYRQVPGGSLEWVSFISFNPTVFSFDQSVKGRAEISRDNSRSEAYLSLLTLHPRDSARYFCAVHTGTGKPAELSHKPARVRLSTHEIWRCSKASCIFVAQYQQHPGEALQYLLQCQAPGGSYSHTAPFAHRRFSCEADESSGTLTISRLELGDSDSVTAPGGTTAGDTWGVHEVHQLSPLLHVHERLSFGLSLSSVETAKLIFGPGTTLTVVPNIPKTSVPEVIVMKSKKLEEGGSSGKAACLARNFPTKNISLEMPSEEVVYKQSTSILTSEGLYNAIKVVKVTKDTEVTCTAKSDNSTTTTEPEKPVTVASAKVCNSTDTSAQDAERQRVNMLSMAVLGLRVLLAKSIAINTLMSIKLFLF